MAKISKEPPETLNFSDEGCGSCHSGSNNDDGPFDDKGLETITRIPDIDMYSTPHELTIEVEMAGVLKKNIELYLHKNTIKLTALKTDAVDCNKTNYVCMERIFGRLYRSIDIPFPVNTSKVKAIFKNGLLTIVIPRVEDKRSEKRSVPIETK
ncbi:MAG: Hsp20/alpha crystallin family protein [Thermodesulfobacteriota bacterium]